MYSHDVRHPHKFSNLVQGICEEGCVRSLEESMGTLFAIPLHCTKQFVFKSDYF